MSVTPEKTKSDLALMSAVSDAQEDFFQRLDALAPVGTMSDTWVPFVEGVIGGTDYREWVQETWEFPPAEVSA